MPQNIKFGVFLPFYAFKNKIQPTNLFNQLKSVVLNCEQLGYDSIWIDDHLMLGTAPILECWTTLSALAVVTKKIKLGTMVTCNSFRNPALLAKMAATFDVLSNGRLELGIGAGVQKNEHNAYGFTFSSSKERIQRLNESVEIIKKLWTKEQASYQGKHYKINNAVCEPKPQQKPHPPIIIGGGGDKLTLKITARLADRYDWGYVHSFEEYVHKMQVLKNHCAVVGRNIEEIEKSCWPVGQIFLGATKRAANKLVSQILPIGVRLEEFTQTSFVGTPEDFMDLIKPYVKLGVTQFMLFFGDLPETTGLELFAQKVIRTYSSQFSR
ncbi:MAG: TIGR03560 family F420-dependent LLM class oxidoreductase [Candidatus Bathyarchaeota archaeon]|nr:MAG: TIGR03560 family F420-dependent LLM class oxidoreductase [Candidatus Bathyarchaeota archaeon]